MIRLAFCLIVLLPSFMPAQSFGDCDQAIELTLSLKNRIVHHDSALVGYGEKMEITAPRKDPYFFAKEHHTIWYTFQSPFSGLLSMDIRPTDPTNDYDFLFLEDSTGRLCEQIAKKEILPLRSVISRNDTSIQSHTGLSAYHKQTNIHSGPGESYGQAIQVKKGRRYYLVLDNVYGGGDGHEIEFHFYYQPKLFGMVRDRKTKEAVQATVIVQKSDTEQRMDSVQADTAGQYVGRIPLEYDQTYRLLFEAEGYFPYSKEINYKSLRENRGKPINVELTPMEVGASLTLDNFYFIGGLAEFLPSSRPYLRDLLVIMRDYPNLRIKIEGHVNGVGHAVSNYDKGYLMDLSQRRAKAVKDYLLNHGIDPARIETQGFGATRMVYPYAQSEFQMGKNRRVELLVLAI